MAEPVSASKRTFEHGFQLEFRVCDQTVLFWHVKLYHFIFILKPVSRVPNAADIFWLFDINIIIHQPNFFQGIVPSFKGYY